MPTLLCLDLSQSMLYPISANDEPLANRRSAALSLLGCLVDFIADRLAVEQLALAVVSDNTELIVPFTRDHGRVKTTLQKSDKLQQAKPTRCCLKQLLGFAGQYCAEAWGHHTLVNVMVVSGGSFIDPVPVSADITSLLPFKFPCMLHFACLNPAPDSKTVAFMNSVLRANEQTFGLYSLAEATQSALDQLVFTITSEVFTPFRTTLSCGKLSAEVMVFPDVHPYRAGELKGEQWNCWNSLEILGFVNPETISSTAVMSKHLVVGYVQKSAGDRQKTVMEPNFAILMHHALRKEEQVAVCQVGPSWFGYLYGLPDAKKSNIVLNLFEPGSDGFPWMGDLLQLDIAPFDPMNPMVWEDPSAPASVPPFPLPAATKPSYAQNAPCWVQNYGIQSDLQKMLRYARKLPDKEVQFFTELNRLVNYALAIGCKELFALISNMLDREKANLKSPAADGQINLALTVLGSGKLRYGVDNFVSIKS